MTHPSLSEHVVAAKRESEMQNDDDESRLGYLSPEFYEDEESNEIREQETGLEEEETGLEEDEPVNDVEMIHRTLDGLLPMQPSLSMPLTTEETARIDALVQLDKSIVVYPFTEVDGMDVLNGFMQVSSTVTKILNSYTAINSKRDYGTFLKSKEPDCKKAERWSNNYNRTFL